MATSNKKYEEYKKNKTREKNKIRKITKHLKSHPNNTQAQQKLADLQVFIGK